MARDDFDRRTKQALAERAGYRCSFPGCGLPTIGPSDEAADSSSATGMACHIAAAAGGPGARRYKPDMSPAERASISNGIWMCYTHGKLIDTDETRFSVPMLQKWRAIAEERARLLQIHGALLGGKLPDYSGIGLPDGTFHVEQQSTENVIIGDALRHSCVPELWGVDVAERVRDFAIEVARNAFQHGQASKFTLEISPATIRLTDDGAFFDIWSLSSSDAVSGGRLAFAAVLEAGSQRVIVSGRRVQNENEIAISRIADSNELEDLTPCVSRIDWKDLKAKTYEIVVDPSCQIVYVVLPLYWTISDSVRFAQKVRRESHDSRRYVFVLEHSSSKAIEVLRAHFPESRIISL
jgi:hypothetical protein